MAALATGMLDLLGRILAAGFFLIAGAMGVAMVGAVLLGMIWLIKALP